MSYGNNFFKKNRDYKPLYKSLENQVGKEKVTEIFNSAGRELDSIMSDFPNVPKGERNHTDNYIFPRVALYRILKKEFGEKNGFAQKFYLSSKGTVKFDILDCTYCRYCKLCECPELIHTFCNTDSYCFGNLSKIVFTREETLEVGKKCDFTLTISK